MFILLKRNNRVIVSLPSLTINDSALVQAKTLLAKVYVLLCRHRGVFVLTGVFCLQDQLISLDCRQLNSGYEFQTRKTWFAGQLLLVFLL